MRSKTVCLALLILLSLAVAPAAARVSVLYAVNDTVVNASTWGDFSTVRSASGSETGKYNDPFLLVSLNASTVTDQYRLLNRSILVFDTRYIPRNASIHQVKLSLYHFAKFGGLGTNTGLSITSGLTAHPTLIRPLDYQGANLSTAAAIAPDIPYASFATGNRFNFTWYSWANRPPFLNTSNYTQVYARLTWDALNSMNGTWASKANTTIAFASRDNSSSTYRPYLEVTWTDFPSSPFQAVGRTAPVPLAVQFNHTGYCDACSFYNWSFGDGTWYNTTQTGNLRNASHLYAASGNYTVNLSATNIAGTALTSKAGYVIAQDDPQIAWTGNATTANLSTAVYFLDSSTGLNQNLWNWSFNADSRDKNVSSLRNWSHRFPQTGWYSVNHSVTTNSGQLQNLTSWLNRTNYIRVVNNTISGDFNATPLSGLAPLMVSFVYTGTGGPEENYTWIFHQDSPVSYLKNPIYTYLNPGTHSVNHSACNDAGCVWVNKSNYITVTTPAPVASFTTDVNTGTQPFTVQFTDTSTNTPTSWLWLFGDGAQNTSQNPSHQYITAGDFTVSHAATNAGGTGWVNMTHRILSSNPAPVAGFTAGPPVGNTTTAIQFTDTSTGTNITGWSWSFGDGATSPVRDPVHTYATCGGESCTFTINHSAIDSVGSPWSTMGWTNETGPFTIFANLTPTVTFTGTPLTGTWPLAVTFTAGQAGSILVDSWFWDFGDGNTSSLKNPSNTYGNPGAYPVTLTATNFTLGQALVAKTGYVTVTDRPPVVDWNATPASGTIPLSVAFVDMSTGGEPTTHFWDFGDGSTSSLRNATHVYTVAGAFSVSHGETNSGGTSWLNRTRHIIVRNPAPVAGFSADPPVGNTTTAISFTDASTGTNVTAWSWTFGDGASSQDRNPAHTYTACGAEYCTFMVNHSATDSAGTPWSSTAWRNETGPFTIYSNLTPNVTFTGAPPTGIRPLWVAFTAIPAGAIGVDSWHWDFGEGNTSAIQDPVHVFQDHRTYHVILTATNFTLGQDVVSKPSYIHVKNRPPEAGFTWDRSTGTRPLQVQFTDTSTNEPDSWLWDFGDGNTSTLQNPVKTYESAGQFSVSLRAGNDGGEDWENRTALVLARNPAPAAGFAADTLVANLSTGIWFTDESSGTNISGWLWDFGDGFSSPARNPVHTFGATGYYTISLTAADSPGTPWNITGTLSRAAYIRVVNNSITPGFVAVPTSAPPFTQISFTDTSTGGPVENCSYLFGDGSTSGACNPLYTYPLAGTYSVSHSACNDAGCSWSNRSDYITIAYPPPTLPPEYIMIGGQGYTSPKNSQSTAEDVAEEEQGVSGEKESITREEQSVPGEGQSPGSAGISSGSGSTSSNGGQGSQGTGGTAGRGSGMSYPEQPQQAPTDVVSALTGVLGDIAVMVGSLLGYLQDQFLFLFGL